MKTVNSLSGGKTSSYIAVHYPADYEVFVFVCVDCHNAGVKIDRKMKQQVNDKLQKYSSHWPEFRATSEDPVILNTMFDLEQKIGREIIWLRGMGWEQMIAMKKAIPNMQKRFCTSILKMQPMFDFLFLRTDLPVKMRIGYRYDEMERAQRSNDIFKFPFVCQYREKSNTWIQRWKEVLWRVAEFPLIDDKIIHPVVTDYWKGQNISFAEDSNCQNCFWKQEQQLKKNFISNNPIMQWAKIMEDIQGRTFKDRFDFHQIERLPMQLDFNYGTGAGCQAGFCTD